MQETSTHKVFPRFAPEGFQEIGTEGWWIMDRQEAVHHWSGSMTKIIGGHNMKMGGEPLQRARLLAAGLPVRSVQLRPWCHLP
jgi:hypothetical protein